ncbi:MAG: DUF3892 domain-containing protein [Candidatus Paceibacterota bacterium]
MAIRITCINKDSGNHANRHTAISRLGWIQDGTSDKKYNTRLEMYDFVKDGGRAYVLDSQGDKAYLMTAITVGGTKYVKTVADETRADNLLSLPEC